jgi:ribulose-phosphate 3-epimerase
MATVAPCVTATDAHAYREQMARIAPFAKRVHIDFSDGAFSPVKMINPIQAYWPEGMAADLHLMLKDPTAQLETVVSLAPQMVILHAESEGNLTAALLQLRALGIKTGVALLQKTAPADARQLIAEADHVLIFSGDLGHFGGQADLDLLRKVAQIRAINPVAEIGWDGGVSTENAAQLVLGGIEVLDVGGAIQRAEDPAKTYEQLIELASHTAN